jgi:hypothetical protein
VIAAEALPERSIVTVAALATAAVVYAAEEKATVGWALLGTAAGIGRIPTVSLSGAPKLAPKALSSSALKAVLPAPLASIGTENALGDASPAAHVSVPLVAT